MLYTNETLKITEREMKFGNVTGVVISEYGRGRREVFLPTPKGLESEISQGLTTSLTIGTSKTGRPRINKSDNSELYLILSTERNYTRRGNGYVRAPKDQKVEIIARGNGADGDAGRIGSWDALILKAHEGDVYRVTWGGYGYGYDATFYVVMDGKVYMADQPEIEDLYDSLGVDAPFTLRFEDDSLKITSDEWVTL